MNILFRTDSSSTIGTGHIMRDLVLAKQYPNSNIFFATENLEGNLNAKIVESGYEVIDLNSNSIDELDIVIKKYKIDMIIIDHYGIDYTFEKQLSILNPKLTIMVLDDTYEKHYCNILLNHNISAQKEKYKKLVPEFCELRCGEAFTLLRDEFREEKKIKREKIYDIFLAMGGADTANLNIKILESLDVNLKVAVVTTHANRNLDELKSYVEDKKNITLFINSNEIAKIINQSRLAIVTPSVVVNEVYFMGIDFIAIKTADNQEDIYSYLLTNGFKVLSKFNAFELKKIIFNIQLINFINLSQEEKKTILEWRNHPSIKKWMFSQEDISLENHLAYIETLKDSKDRVYFLVKKANKMIGVIDFTSIDMFSKKAYIGLYANPNLYGVGSLLMEEIVAYGFNDLKLNMLISEVFEHNHKAIKLYKKFRFKEINRRDNLVIMELKNENIQF